MNPEHLELLRRALPHLVQPWVVDEVVAFLAEGVEHVVPDTMATCPFLDDMAVRFCYWMHLRARHPSLTNDSYVKHYARALEKELPKHETPIPIRTAAP